MIAESWRRRMGQEGLDGVSIFNPDGKLIGRINLPERCANLCFGGTQRNRFFMTGSTLGRACFAILGLGLLCIGFLLQIIGNWPQ
jgi:hypothetical protein